MDDDDDDNFVSYGTPLPEIEDEYILQKRAARDLEVRDEKGRKRFHGAFTGGFSAGYFNTVGTKEGWEPSTFISSRNKVANRVQQNPEDFMDDEDFGEFGISTRKIHTSDKFKDSLLTETRKRKFGELDSVIPGEAPLKDIVKPASNSIGVQILTKLGWRPGQGIGPRIKKQTAGVKVYGCSLPDSLLEEDDPYALAYTFAPEDVNADFYQPKDNTFGLGYTGLSKESVLSAHVDEYQPTITKTWLKKDKKKLTISGQAFGVGAFEEDDDDIYGKDDMSQYDFSDLNKKSDQLSITYDSNKDKSSTDNVLEGFYLASHPPLTKKYYPPPDLPPNYRPMSSLSKKSSCHIECGFTPRHKLTAGERSFLLGEKKFESFSLKSTALPVKENKQAIQSKVEITKPSGSTPTFKPFPNDSAKQKRYEEYLEWQRSGVIEKFVQPSSMTEWEKQQELEEFARSSILFKPLSAVLSSKFESRSHLSVEHEVMDALEKAKKEKIQKPLIKKKLVGLKNRKSFEWHPSSLLCKRFNVPNPFPNSEPISASTSQQSKSIFDNILFETPSGEKSDSIPTCSSLTSQSKVAEKLTLKESSEESLKEPIFTPMINVTSKQEDVPLENKKPAIDFFKEIFENTSSEDEEEEDIPKQSDSSDTIVAKSKIVEEEDKSISKISNAVSQEEKIVPKRTGFGVFANLDLDALNNRSVSKFENKQVIEKVQAKEEVTVASNESSTSHAETEVSMQQDDLYGPELPPNYSEISSKEVHKSYSKKHKVKHKHKHNKHKTKKKKKKKSHKSSDDYSSDSNEDIPPEIILEKLKKLQKKL